MTAPLTRLRRLAADRRGSTAIEYALIAAIVAVTAIGGLQAFGDSMDQMWNVVIAAIVDALAGA
jgi:pilus assembly protein Flp/PilA